VEPAFASMASNILVPLLIGNGPLELVEDTWVVPKLVERINYLENKLMDSKNKPDEYHSANNTLSDRIISALRVAGRSLDAGLTFM
jgi:hypothetical protein